MLEGLKRRIRNVRGNHSDLDDEDTGNGIRTRVEKKMKSRRPPNTAFRQQRLKSWQPIMTSKVVLPLLLVSAVIFIPLGLAFLITVNNVQLIEVNYSKCTEVGGDYVTIPKSNIKSHFKGKSNTVNQWKYSDGECSLKLDIPVNIKENLYLYYKLTNFYQNHRKYVESYDWLQLKGEAITADSLSSKCDPMRVRDDKIVYPCGLVANSMFNDTIGNLEGDTNSYTFSDQGIAWSSDLKLYQPSQYSVDEVVPPQNWISRYPNGYTAETLKAVSEDERFMNWMKTAALPSFMKLYGVYKGKDVASGTYTVKIGMNYPVTGFGGTKSIVLSTSSVFGGDHFGLGICYLIVGGLSVLFMVIFVIKQLLTRRRESHEFMDHLEDRRTSI